jgi:hypothetical protein
MVVSTATYHIVANIVPPDAGGPLEIGTIIDSLQELNPLNEGEEIKLAHERMFCIHEEGFEATRNQVCCALPNKKELRANEARPDHRRVRWSWSQAYGSSISNRSRYHR